jgi:putative ABC transport system substrate-binding protein
VLTRTYAAELVALSPDVILCESTNNLVTMQRLSPAAPIVFITVSDPVAQGFVVNMAHPGANITGFANYEYTVAGKWLDLLKQMVPSITHVGVVFDPQTAPQFKFYLSVIESAAATFGVNVAATPIQNVAEIDTVFANFARKPNGGLILPPGQFNTIHRKALAKAAARHRVPAIYSNPAAVRDGGLMRYSTEYDDQFRQAGVYVDRILKGTKAGDLPVQTPTKFTLGINLNAARDLGIEVPLSLLLIADEQIE